MWDELQENAFANGQYDLAEYYAAQEKAARDAATEEGCAWPTATVAKTVKLPVGVIKPVTLTQARQG